MREESCPMCSGPLEGAACLVQGSVKHRNRWSRAQLLICRDCYSSAGPDPETGLSRPASLRENSRYSWTELVGRGEPMPPTPCTACGRLVIRRGDPLLKRVTCSPACSTSLTRSRNGGAGSGLPCETCGRPVLAGRADSRYCGSACRQKAYRQRRNASATEKPAPLQEAAPKRGRGRTLHKALEQGISSASGLAEGMASVALDQTVSPEQAAWWSAVLAGEVLPQLADLKGKLDAHARNSPQA